MNCFRHNDRPAVGLCKHCFKAVCRECILEAAGAVVCSPACAAEASSVDALLRNVPRTRRGSVVIYGGIGTVMLLLGAIMRDAAGMLIALLGVFMLIGAYLSHTTARERNKAVATKDAG